ncbi:oligosaccharide flippase family protein [Chloroflexota bacterium]
MAISVLNIIRNSLKFSSVNLLTGLISLPVSVYVATIILPEEYGVFGFLGLWLMYATLIRPGLTMSGYREIPVLLGKGEEKEALKVQNIAVTSDMLYSVLPVIVILGASFFYTEPLLKIGLVLTAISYGATQLANYWDGVNFLRQKFNVVARARLIAAIVLPLVIVASVYWLKVYALIIAPIVLAMFLGIYYRKWGPINFHFTFNWQETVRLVKPGIVLQSVALLFWAFRLADRTIIASTLSLEQLGLYTFAIGFITRMLMIPRDFNNVLQPILYKELGRASSIYEGFKDTMRIAVYMALGVSVLIPLAQFGFYLIVSLITVNYVGSIPVFYILSYNVYLASVGAVADMILMSKVVNKQKISLCIYSIGLAVNIIFDLLVIKLGYGVVGVAWVTICTQGLVTLTLYYLTKNYMFQKAKDYLRFQIAIWVPFLLTIPFYFLHNYLSVVAPNMWTFAGVSLAAQAILWGLVIGVFYRSYLPISDIRAIIKEISMTVMGKLPENGDGL